MQRKVAKSSDLILLFLLAKSPAYAPLTWNLPVILQGAHKQKPHNCFVDSQSTHDTMYELANQKSAIIATDKSDFQEISPPKHQQHTPARVSADESG